MWLPSSFMKLKMEKGVDEPRVVPRVVMFGIIVTISPLSAISFSYSSICNRWYTVSGNPRGSLRRYSFLRIL